MKAKKIIVQKQHSGQAGLEIIGAVTMISSLTSLIMVILPNPITEVVFHLIEAMVY